MAPPLPRPPVRIEPVFDAPARIRRLVEARAPYWPVQRYFANDAEYASLSALVGDNDFMWHSVRPTGRPRGGMARLTLESELACEGGRFSVRDGDRELGRFDAHRDDLDLAEVVRRFRLDLAARGVELAWPDDPVRDPTVIRRLTEAYVRYPAAAPSAA